jgi:hypothetical protein
VTNRPNVHVRLVAFELFFGHGDFPLEIQSQNNPTPNIAGAHDRNRTDDLFLTKEVLYRLSYVSDDLNFRRTGYLKNLAGNCDQHRDELERVAGIEPASSAWKAEVLPLNYTRQNQRRSVPIACDSPVSRRGPQWWRG